MKYPHPLLAREGWPFIGLAFVLSLILTLVWSWKVAIPAYIVLVFVIQFFRDPPRAIPDLANAVLSPADGRIVKIEKVRDPYADRDALLVSVFMNVFNVHSNRASVNGRVRAVHYFPGLFVNADLDKASNENERNAVIIDAPDISKGLSDFVKIELCDRGSEYVDILHVPWTWVRGVDRHK